MAKNTKQLTENNQKDLLILKSTYEMHCKTKEEALLMGKTDNIDKIDKIIDDTVKRMSEIDPDFARKCVEERKAMEKKFDITDMFSNDDVSLNIFEKIGSYEDETPEIGDDTIKKQTEDFYGQFSDDDASIYDFADKIDDDTEERKEEKVTDSFSQAPQEVTTENRQGSKLYADDMIHNNIDPNAQYDLIPLPSKGECYAVKIDRVPVGYLTAADENLITSPNLYESGNISSILLKKKVLNKDINIDNLVSGDVDAIMVFLRGTSYGNEFPIVATDPTNGNAIETTVDLSTLKYKPFTLKGDENGHFDFKLPKTGHVIKFKFLTKKDEKLLQKLNKKETQGTIVYDINDAIDKIKNALKTDDKLNDSDRKQIIDASNKLQKWSDNLKKNQTPNTYTKTITNTMEMQIVSVDGNLDRKFIHDFVMNMPATDSLAFRRYIFDNQPGVDFEVEVERPVSQGGGTFKCFLEWDDYVFWHIA